MKLSIRRLFSILGLLVLITGAFTSYSPAVARPAASPAMAPASVTIAGSLQTELGCAGDWDPACGASHLVYDANDDVWQRAWTIPAGAYEYKAALNDSWTVNYGQGGVPNGSNIPLSLAADTSVKFYYDDKSHWVTDNVNSVIATVPGSFQSELGCAGDWDPGCLRSWLEDPDGNGIYSFQTKAIPAGNYEAKVAINESWTLNYGAGGAQNGANIPFSVVVSGSTVAFSYDSASHVLAITVTPPTSAHDNNVEWNGLRFDSRDLLYRTPAGAVPAGTPVMVRFRTFHNDVTSVDLRVYDTNDSAQSIVAMKIAASDVSCYQADLVGYTCDFWQATLDRALPDNLWYRFIIRDGTKTVYYADDTTALDGGLGAPSDNVIDNSFALMFYKPGFQSPAWAKDAVIYQIFPDRFRDGRKDNNAHTGDTRYDDPVLSLHWGTLPEGYCRNYADGNTNCPWRFDPNPPASSPTKEQPRGRDYMGGDLKGVDQYLDYLKSLGVNTLYFNPIFDAASNHSYDTQNYYKVDPYFGTQKDWDNLVKHAKNLGMRIVLDGVFNHLSSDSPFFDRYHHYATDGACESLSSPYRAWFYFQDVPAGTGTCVGSGGSNSATYTGWFGFDSIPVINKTLPEVQAYFLTNQDSVSRHWLVLGAGGWRMDVMGDSSFPDGYWQQFRDVVKTTKPDALIISETWQKDSTLLRMLRGDRADTTMNYRLRDAVIGLLAPQNFDSKGFADSGYPISPAQFAARIESIREDYPDAAYYALMNLLDSHDTERLRWTLTPGAETTAEKELNAANVAAGKQRQRIASLIQFTVPGAPTIFYGDEVGMTGDDDPDDRRTYPWADLGGQPDQAMLDHYKALAQLRKANTPLVDGDLRVLLADDGAKTLAYGRKTGQGAALVAINTDSVSQTITIPLAGYIPDGVTFNGIYAVNTGPAGPVTVSGGTVTLTLSPLSGLLLATGTVDLTPPAAPAGLAAVEGSKEAALTWNAVPGAAAYNVYLSPLSGGGYVKANTDPVAGTSFTANGLTNAQLYYFTVRALDAAGNESAPSNEATAVPHYLIGWANLQWPPTLTHTISAVTSTDAVYGQVWIDGVTSQPGATPTLRAQLGFGPSGSDPAGNPAWVWVDAAFNVDSGNNDEFGAQMLPDQTGAFDYAYRYTTTNGRDWLYADLDGTGNGYNPDKAGKMTVNPSADTTAPAVPANLRVTNAGPAEIDLAWDEVTGDPTMYGYEVLRGDTAGGPYALLGLVAGATTFADTSVVQDNTYFYVVRAVDTSFNRSGTSNEVSKTAETRTVTLVFTVTVPDTTDATGRSVYIAGTLSRLDGGLPDWNPGGVVLTKVDATHWTITFTGKEYTAIEYKYTLGDWDHVEKDNSCGEIGNRQLTLSYGSNGTQAVNDTVPNWRNVSPCGN